MNKITYLTTNPLKIEEINRRLRDRYGFEVEILSPGFEVLEIQATSSSEVAAFSAKYATEKLGIPVLKSDTALYVDALGGLPGPYNTFFDKQIGVDRFLELMSTQEERGARLEHSFAFCEPGKEPMVFSGGSVGRIARTPSGRCGRWHDLFYIPAGEKETLSVLREKDPRREQLYWGCAINEFAGWYSSQQRRESGDQTSPTK